MQQLLILTFCCLLQFITSFNLIETGRKYSEDQEYKVYLSKTNDDPISAWHDIPLFTEEDRTNTSYNMVVEIPRFTQAKFEISRDKMLNPIVHDKEDSGNRYLPNVFPWHGHVCNYGAFPQTWENPFHLDPWTGLNGDKDPIDVCEIGHKIHERGAVIQVKVLGVFAMIDEVKH